MQIIFRQNFAMIIPQVSMNRITSTFIKEMQRRKLSLALVESMTCGLATHQLSRTPGTSDVLKGSIICYRPEIKKALLKVPQSMIDRYSCESKEVTRKLAANLPKLIAADVYAAITGLASPGGSETKEKPVGTVFFCIKKGNRFYEHRQRFYGTPLEIKKKACYALYEFIRSKL